MRIKDIPLNGGHEPQSGSASEAGHIPLEYTCDNNGFMLSYKDSNGYWSECTRDSNGRGLSYKSSTGCWRESTYDTKGRELSYKDSDGFWCEHTYDTHGRELSYKTNDFNGFRIADDGNYVLHYDNTNDTFLAGCSGVLTKAEAIERWNRDDDRAKLYTLAIGVSEISG